MSSIFLCHSSTDKGVVRHIADRLKRLGAKIWLDEAEIRVGDSLLEKIGDGINGADFFGVVLSASSVASPWVKRELEIAIMNELRSVETSLLPIIIEDCAIPPFLSAKRYADCRSPSMFNVAMSEIAEVMGLPEQPQRKGRSFVAVFSIYPAQFWTPILKALDDPELSIAALELRTSDTSWQLSRKIVQRLARAARRGKIVVIIDHWNQLADYIEREDLLLILESCLVFGGHTTQGADPCEFGAFSPQNLGWHLVHANGIVSPGSRSREEMIDWIHESPDLVWSGRRKTIQDYEKVLEMPRQYESLIWEDELDDES